MHHTIHHCDVSLHEQTGKQRDRDGESKLVREAGMEADRETHRETDRERDTHTQ